MMMLTMMLLMMLRELWERSTTERRTGVLHARDRTEAPLMPRWWRGLLPQEVLVQRRRYHGWLLPGRLLLLLWGGGGNGGAGRGDRCC